MSVKNYTLPKPAKKDEIIVPEFLQTLLQTIHATESFQPLAVQISQVLEVKNLLYGVLGLPLDLRNFLDALIAVSGGRKEWFECVDIKLATQLLGDNEEDGNSKWALQKKIQRGRTKFEKWQETKGYKLIEMDRGHSKYARDSQGNVDTRRIERQATRYNLPILLVLETILRECLSGQRWNNFEAMKAVIERHVGKLHGVPYDPDSGGYKNMDKQIEKLIRQADAAIIRSLKISKESGGSPEIVLERIMQTIKGNTQKFLATKSEKEK